MGLKWKLAALLAVGVALSACSKKQEATAPPATPPPAATTTAPAAVPAPAAAQPTAPAATPAAAAAVSPEEAAKAAAIQLALAEEEIASDPRGQWAVSATSSTTYASDKSPDSKASYAPGAATGAPNVERFGDNGNGWAPETADKGVEWLEVKFAKPVQATELRIRQNCGPGAIIKVETVDEGGARHLVWQGVDNQAYTPNTIVWWRNTFEKTSFKVVAARITLATNAVPGWNEIDAVQLLGD